jgi:hypothetical protein
MSGAIGPEVQELRKNYPFLIKPFTPTDLIETIRSLKLS